MVCGCASGEAKWSGEDTFAVDAAFYGCAHCLPYFGEVFPYLGAFAAFYVFPELAACVLTPFEDFGEGVEVIHVGSADAWLTLFGEFAASDAEYGPAVGEVVFVVIGAEFHSVGVEGEEFGGFPDYFGGCCRGEAFKNGYVGEVAFACSGERAVECHFKACGFGVA